MKEVKNFFYEFGILADVCNQAQILLQLSCMLVKLVNTQTKGIKLICLGKNNICISWVFNGFRYRYASDLLGQIKQEDQVALNRSPEFCLKLT